MTSNTINWKRELIITIHLLNEIAIISQYFIWNIFYECLDFKFIKTSNKIAFVYLKSDCVTKSVSTNVEISFLVSKGMDILWLAWNLSLMLLFKVFYSYFYACWIVYGEYFTLVDLLCVNISPPWEHSCCPS